jgi:hypothetical protein
MACAWIMPMRLRLIVAARIVGSWLGGLAVLAAIISLANRGGDTLLGVEFLGAASIPVLCLVLVIALPFPYSVSRHPLIWTFGGVLIALFMSEAQVKHAGVWSLLVSVPAALIFLLLAYLWPLSASSRDDSAADAH